MSAQVHIVSEDRSEEAAEYLHLSHKSEEDRLNAQLQQLAHSAQIVYNNNKNVSSSASTANSIRASDGTSTPELASTPGVASPYSASEVATPADFASAEYFSSSGNRAAHHKSHSSGKIATGKQTPPWTGDSAYQSEIGSSNASTRSSREEIPNMPQMPAQAKVVDRQPSTPSAEVVDEAPSSSDTRSLKRRSSSASPSDIIGPALKARRSSSLLNLKSQTGAENLGWFGTEERTKELILPSSPAAVAPPASRPLGWEEDTIEAVESSTASARATVEEEKEASAQDNSHAAVQPSRWQRYKAWVRRTYFPTESPPLVLPSAPTDAEKIMYLKTNRWGLHGLGVLAFLSLSVGMWLFVAASVAFYWFGAFVVFLQVYMMVSYWTSVCGGEFDYEAHKKAVEDHPIDPVTAPMVDIYLPVCKEPMEILENTWNHVKKLQWPEGKLKVWVLDDGDDARVKALAAEERFNFNYIVRDNRPHLKKAGNLRYAYARTDAPFFAIFDADFCPRTDFLMEIMPEHFAHPDTCIVQTPQFFRTVSDQTWVEQGAGAVQEVFYRVVQTNRNKWGASVCVGSNAVYRRESLLEVGGTAEIGFSEDVHTGFYAMCRGWKLRYMPLNLANGICPDTPRAYFSQQMRWAMGSTTLVTNPEFWKSPLNRMQKICFLCGLLYYSAISLGLFLSPMPGMMLIWIRPQYVRYYNLAFAIPSVLFGIAVIRLWAKAEYGWNVNFVQTVQSYAYLAAVKKRIMRSGLTWVASGDSKVHKSNEYREMRIVAIVWNFIILALIVTGIGYQTAVTHRLHWYDTMPLVVLTLFNLYLAHRFLLWSGKI